MKIIGIIIIFTALLIFILTLVTEKLREHLKLILSLATVFGCLGFGITFQEQLIEIPIPGVGTIKTAAQQTVEDAKFVKETRETVLAQSKTIGLVVQQANELLGKITAFESFLQISQQEINSRLEALNPYTKPIMAGSCNVITVTKPWDNYLEGLTHRRADNFSDGSFVRFSDNDSILLALKSIETVIDKKPFESGTTFKAEFLLSSESVFLKKPVSLLKQTKKILMRDFTIPRYARILDGRVTCNVNAAIFLEFTIPQQITGRDQVIQITDVSQALEYIQ